MKNDIAGIKINWTYVPELVDKATKALQKVEERLKKEEEKRAKLRKQRRELAKFLKGPVAREAAKEGAKATANS